MEVIELVDGAAAAALEHASALQHRLRAVAADRPALDGCAAEMHRLIGDIVSLRNAAELLKRAQPR